MINLLPPGEKEAYRYARRNHALSRWVITCAFCCLGAMALAAGGYVWMNISVKTTKQQIALTQTELDKQNVTVVQKQVGDISNNLKLAVQVLSKEILFSDLLKQLATVTPNNTVLTNLSITQAQGAVDITAQTVNYDAATQLQVNLADRKNQIFTKADIINIVCANSSGNGSSKYPCTVNIRALFATDNPFLFINQKAKK